MSCKYLKFQRGLGWVPGGSKYEVLRAPGLQYANFVRNAAFCEPPSANVLSHCVNVIFFAFSYLALKGLICVLSYMRDLCVFMFVLSSSHTVYVLSCVSPGAVTCAASHTCTLMCLFSCVLLHAHCSHTWSLCVGSSARLDHTPFSTSYVDWDRFPSSSPLTPETTPLSMCHWF